MRRLLLPTLLLLLAAADVAVAFHPDSTPKGARIGILRTDVGDDVMTIRVASLVRGYLARELEREGFEAFDTRLAYDDLLAGKRGGADFYVEFVRGNSTEDGFGAIGRGGRQGVEMSLIVSRVAAALRVYDGRTLDLIDEFDVHARDTSVLPTAVGVGAGRRVGVWVGVPVMRGMRHRTAAREAAEEAAEEIAEIVESDSDRD